MEDGLLRAISVDSTIRVVVATTTNLVEQARLKHRLSFTAAAALGRALTGACLMSAIVARRGRITMKFQGNGPLGKVVVDASSQGTVRGYVENPSVELPLNSLGNFDVGGAIGKAGYLHVTVDQGFGFPYTSTVELCSGEVGEDVNHYLVTSEQKGSVVILGTHLNARGTEAAGGLIIQLLPDYTEETICKIENNITTFGTFTFLMRRGMTLRDILDRVLDGFTIRTLTEIQPLSFACECTSQRFIEALRGLDKQDLLTMAAKEGHVEGRCHFCNAVYQVGRDCLLNMGDTYGHGSVNF